MRELILQGGALMATRFFVDKDEQRCESCRALNLQNCLVVFLFNFGIRDTLYFGPSSACVGIKHSSDSLSGLNIPVNVSREPPISLGTSISDSFS